MKSISKDDGIVKEYTKVMKKMLGITYDGISDTDIEDAVLYSINKRHKTINASIHNSYKEKTVNMNLYELSNYIIERKPILTAYGVMFQQHGKSPNPFCKLFHLFMSNRDIHKNEMFSFPPGSDEYNRLELTQLLDKLDANALYGGAGMASCIFYSIYIVASITMQGRSEISAATMFFEQFLDNNVLFRSMNEVITWIYNVIGEDRKYDDSDILDRNVSVKDAFSNIAKACTWDWTPTFEEMDIIYDILTKLSQEDLNRIYYKNNLFSFCDNTHLVYLIRDILQSLHEPFVNPNKPPEEISDKLEYFQDLLREYVFYNHAIIDKIDRTFSMIRKSIVLSDTDSAIVCLDGWYRYILDKVKDINMKICRTKLDMTIPFSKDEYGDSIKVSDMIVDVEPELDYDFYTDEVIEKTRMDDILSVIPQDGLRYSIINILCHSMGNLCNEYLITCMNNNNSSINNPYGCKIYLKNEYLFKSILIEEVKKHYASIMELREGHFTNKLAITGMEMDKTTLNEGVKNRMQKILYEDVLNSPNFDQIKLLKNMAILEHQIKESLRNGDKEFYKPVTIKSLNHYPNPMSIQGIKASVVWNEVKDPELPGIDLSTTNSIDIVKMSITPKNILKIKDSNPDIYERVMKLFNDDPKTYKREITSIAIPKDLDIIPEWVKEFIDYNTIVTDNISSFPFNSLLLTRMDGKKNNVNYTNILSL